MSTVWPLSDSIQSFIPSDSPLAIRFNASTTFNELTEPVTPIPDERFRFQNHSELLGLAKTNTHLPAYRVKMTIADKTAEGLFVGFDEEITKLHNMRAYEAGHLLDSNDDDDGDDMLGNDSVSTNVVIVGRDGQL
ncbi:hypothetical protein Bca52824_028051 [Brassica carinata]|uniref:Uncharacterized protein n=1 Tax=Brassica carinata TaxID=52824 RepID=A0A8X8APC5_BRACI|nr:hypothetical protein Bca52824_028051 [Brassica carinata]